MWLSASFLTTDDLNEDKVPVDLCRLLMEKCRDYHNSDPHKEAWMYFTRRILPSVNACNTKYERRKHNELLSKCFSYTDEAFALLMLINYEPRWRSQHAAKLQFPDATNKEREVKWEDARCTSSTDGTRRGQSWKKEGVVQFNVLCAMVQEQRSREELWEVEADLRLFWREEAGMPPFAEGGENVKKEATPKEPNEPVVEAVVECDTHQI